MARLVDRALQNLWHESVQKGLREPGYCRIMVVGVGGAGNNTVSRIMETGIVGAECIALNTDMQHLNTIHANNKILIGETVTRGLGSGGDPKLGRAAIEESKEKIDALLKDVDIVFVTAGMGGGTGTGASPVVAEIAKKQNAVVIGMVSTPFNVERARLVKADEGLDKLRKKADSVVVLDNNRLLEFVPNLPIDQAFSVMDQLIAETVKGITETITLPSLINLDYADMRTIMESGGLSAMLWGEADMDMGADALVKEALNHPLLNVDYRGAHGALIHVTGGPNMTLKYVHEVAEKLTNDLDVHANVILGARVLPEFENRCRVMAIMTGVQSPNILGPSTGAEPRLISNKKLNIDFVR